MRLRIVCQPFLTKSEIFFIFFDGVLFCFFIENNV